jgi:membrane protease YdiL (CAAX protease family)
MSLASQKERPHRIPSTALFGFLALTFLITWGLIGFYVLAPETASARFGEISGSHPFFFLATWAPAISGFALLLHYSGTAGLRAFLTRLFLWRVSIGWVGFILIVIPLVFVAGSLIKSGPVLALIPPEGASAKIAILFMMLFLGPIEEFGWRGVAQPILQRYMAPIWAGILIGMIWGFWHLPAFFLSGTVFAGWNFLPFFVGNIVLAVLVTPIFNAARGSLLWPMLFHWQLINPFWPDAQPWDTWILVAVAAVVVWWNRDTMFTRAGAVKEVLPPMATAAARPAE